MVWDKSWKDRVFVEGKVPRGIMVRDGKRYYLDGQPVPPKLPPAYGWPPQGMLSPQNCGNCRFIRGGFCKIWKSEVRTRYWCKLWKKSEHKRKTRRKPYGYES